MIEGILREATLRLHVLTSKSMTTLRGMLTYLVDVIHPLYLHHFMLFKFKHLVAKQHLTSVYTIVFENLSIHHNVNFLLKYAFLML